MIHSRPGFAPRTSDKTPAKLNADMIPALHKNRIIDTSSPLKVNLPETSPEQLGLALARAAAARIGPEIITNPSPSAPPILTTPHKE
jgi:hypothetical protein